MDRQTVVQDLVRLAKELTSQDDPEDAMMDLVGAQGDVIMDKQRV